MKGKLALAALAAAAVLAIVGAAAAGSAARPAVNSPEGIAHTEEVTAARLHHTTPGGAREYFGPHRVNVHVHVRGVVAQHGLVAGSYDASLYCPAPVAKHETETFTRTGLALSAAASFALSVPMDEVVGVHGETARCWLHVRVRGTTDAEDSPTVQRNVMIPVTVDAHHAYP